MNRIFYNKIRLCRVYKVVVVYPRKTHVSIRSYRAKTHTGGVGVVGSKPAASTKSFSLTQYLLVKGLYCSALFCVRTLFSCV